METNMAENMGDKSVYIRAFWPRESINQVIEASKVTHSVTIWKLGRTVRVYSMVQRREKEKDSRYIQEASAPAAVTVYQTCNIMYICNTLG